MIQCPECSAQHWTYAKLSGQDHPPIAQIPALLDHVQDVGLSASASQTGEEEDCGPGGGVGMSVVVVIVKPVHRYLSSICCLNKLTAEMSETCNSAMWVFLKMNCNCMYSFVIFFVLLMHLHVNNCTHDKTVEKY